MITEPILLSDCDKNLLLDDKDEYHINIEPSEYQLIRVAFYSNKPASKFKHPNILATRKKVLEFKHYRKTGSKFWTSKAGVEHTIVIPRNKIKLIPEKGYSYVKAEINGVKVTFNVSGATVQGWTDFLGKTATISVNHPLKELKKLCEVAVRNSPFEEMKIPKIDKNEEFTWNILDAKANPKIKNALVKLIEQKKEPTICLTNGYSPKSGYAIDCTRNQTWKRVKEGETTRLIPKDGGLKRITAMIGSLRYSIKMNQIDWYETAKLNGIKI